MLIKEADAPAAGLSADDFIKQKLGQGYTLVSSIALPAGDYGVFRLNGETAYPGPDGDQYGEGPTSRYANEIRLCRLSRTESEIESGVTWDDQMSNFDGFNSMFPGGLGFAYIVSREPLPSNAGAGLGGSDVAFGAHIILGSGGIKIGNVISIDGSGDKIVVDKILLNQAKLDSLKAFVNNYKK
jgi:hypothetical protein